MGRKKLQVYSFADLIVLSFVSIVSLIMDYVGPATREGKKLPGLFFC